MNTNGNENNNNQDNLEVTGTGLSGVTSSDGVSAEQSPSKDEVKDIILEEQADSTGEENLEKTGHNSMPADEYREKVVKPVFYGGCIMVVAIIIAIMVLLPGSGNNNSSSVVEDVVLSGNALEVDEAISEAINNNAFVEAQIGPADYVYFLYNTKGEVVIESTGGVEYKKDNHEAIIVDDNGVSVINGADPLYEFKYANRLFGSTAEVDESNGMITYITTVQGEENIRKLYDNFGEGYSDSIIQTLSAGVSSESVTEDATVAQETSADDGTADTGEAQQRSLPDDVKLEFRIILDDLEGNDVFMASKIVGLGDSAEYYDWFIYGYYAMDDWELPSSWYGDIENQPITEVQAEAQDVLKKMDINMLKLMNGLNDVVDGLQTIEIPMTEYFGMSEEEKQNTIEIAITDLEKCMYGVNASTSDIMAEIENLEEDEDFDDVGVMLSVLYVCDQNNWLYAVDTTAGTTGTTGETGEVSTEAVSAN